MIGLLRAILAALREVLSNQAALRKDLEDQFIATDAMIEHLRVLIEGDELPINVNPPTFTPTGEFQ